MCQQYALAGNHQAGRRVSDQNDRDGDQRNDHNRWGLPRGAPVDVFDIGVQSILLHLLYSDRVHVVACEHLSFSISGLFVLGSTLRQRRKRPRGRDVKEMQNRPQKPENLLEIRLLGTPTFLRADGEPVVLSGRKDRALLAYLVAHAGVALSRDRLVELIWPDAAEGAGRASLRQSLSTLRKMLGEQAGALIAADRDTVTLGTEGLVLDAAMLEALAVDPDAAQAVPSGEFLEGLTAISPSFDTWRATEQARLSALACKVLGDLAAKAEVERRFVDAAALLAQALTIDPLAEATHRKLMQLHAAQGRADVALRQFSTLEKQLDAELGVRPEKETLDLVRDIRNRRQKGAAPISATPESEEPPSQDTSQSAFEASFGLDLSLPEKPSIAVLPFVNLSSDPEQEFFSDGIGEDIITSLSKIDDLLVVARNSTLAYKGKAIDVKRVGEEQGVRYVLEGSVRKAGNRVRVTAQLIDATTGHHIWAERYDRNLDDLFAIQDDITREVVVALEVRLRSGEQVRIRSSGTENVEAWECVRLGMDALNRVTPEGLIEARRLISKALEIDPDYPMGWASLGWLHFHEADISTGPDEKTARGAALESAMDAGRRALELDRSCVEAYAILALCCLSLEKYDDAIDKTEKVIVLAPNHAGTLATSAVILSKSGLPDRAFELIRKAMRLCPLYPSWYLYVLATACRLQGRNEGAVTALEEAIRRNPDSLAFHVNLASALGELGRPEEARKPVAAILNINPEFSIANYTAELSYRDPAELKRFEDGLTAAGLPQ
jgi:TolB-like protein